MKKIILSFLLIILTFSCSPKDDLETGILLYNNKEYSAAKVHLEKASQNDKSGKAFFYLGKTLLNLEEYEKAISNFENSYEIGFEKSNSEFYIACAYSQMNETNESLKYLLICTKDSTELIKRVSEDQFLINFRNSKEYNEYKVLITYPLKGIIPNSKDELLKYMFSNGSIYGIDTPNQDGWFLFNEDGKFFYQEGGGFVSIINTGKWHIDESNKTLILDYSGECQELDFITSTQSPEEQKESLQKGVFESNNKKYVWYKESKESIKDEISFNDIELSITNYFIPNDNIEVAVYNRFGNLNTNKIIKKEIGKIIEK